MPDAAAAVVVAERAARAEARALVDRLPPEFLWPAVHLLRAYAQLAGFAPARWPPIRLRAAKATKTLT